jgi:hypothetical protein
MSFRIVPTKDQSQPLFVCDACNQPIQQLEDGFVLWHEEQDSTQYGIDPFEPLIIHNMKCDPRDMSRSMSLVDFVSELQRR